MGLDDDKAVELAVTIGTEADVKETSEYDPASDNGFIRNFYRMLTESDDCGEECDDECEGDCEDFYDGDEYCEGCENCADEDEPYLTDEELEMFACKGCEVNTLEISEYYMVQFSMWQTVVPKHLQQDMLCIGCLEVHLGRKLSTSDFTEAPVNYMGQKSERLIDRLGSWFTGELYDSEKETLVEAIERLTRERSW